ncbi:MAG: DUF86 domain-containing protein [Candidatus Marinimicrobia bacterium]|nr:DUF86 domain-containing protein [Candidatus Neomarinimicrobiota bacterium]
MIRDMRVYLQDIWESILAAEEYTRGLTKEEFLNNRQVQDAVIRRLEVIGEAVKYLSGEFKSKYPEIAWAKIAGLRDVLIHQYFGINLKRVWEVVKTDLPLLKKDLIVIIEGEDD